MFFEEKLYTRKNKVAIRRIAILFLLFFMLVGIAAQPNEVYAAAGEAREETSEYLPLAADGKEVRVGRYQFNYTGNWNYLSRVDDANRIEWDIQSQQAIAGFTNSSKATLTRSSGAKGIVKAYLIWETRKAYDAGDSNSNHVIFRAENGGYRNIYADYAYCDNRTFVGWRNPARASYCMVADVTNIVKAYGYGDYYVANIPVYHPATDYNDQAGGMNPAAWQLVVIEEGNNFPVRAVTMKVGASFRFGDWDYDGYNGGYVYPNGNVYNQENYRTVSTAVAFNNGIKTKSTGDVTGQVLVGCIDDPGTSSTLSTALYTQQSAGGMKKIASAGSYPNIGLCRNNNVVSADKCVSVNLSDVSGGLGNGATVVGAQLNNIFWNTQYYIGVAVDIAFPDFVASQTTTVNSSTGVMVQGSIKNVTASSNTGIYDGTLVVYIDRGLDITDATAFVNGVPIRGGVSGNVVTFTGLNNLTTGNVITYAISCQPNGTGNGRYDNSDNFSGYLRSDGVNTGYHVDNVCTSSSYALAKYKLTLNAGNGIESVSGAGDYVYGQTVRINAAVKTGYHWKDWTGDYNSTVQNYSFRMPASDVTLTANAEANEYILHFETNGGAEVTPIPDMTIHYDETVTLPDASDAYVKYTLDGINVTPDVLSGAISLSGQTETEEEPEAEGEDAVATSQPEEDTEAVGTAETAEPDMTYYTESELDETPEEGERDKAAYESVYMGWATEEEKDYFEPQWTPGASVEASVLVDTMGVTEQNGATINLYAVWDDCPWIKAQTLYYSLEQAQSGFITADEILSHATAYDREDGDPIEPGEHEDGTSFTIPDYAPTDFTQFDSEGGCTENLTVVDSAGNIYRKMIWVYIVDTTATEVLPDGTTRFINEYYYYQPYELGGLRDDSVWKTDPEYVQTLTEAFENLKNDTPIESYHSTYEENLEMREYIDEHGFGNSKEPDALRGFYDRFMAQD